jgi:hypothetical protein
MILPQATRTLSGAVEIGVERRTRVAKPRQGEINHLMGRRRVDFDDPISSN